MSVSEHSGASIFEHSGGERQEIEPSLGYASPQDLELFADLHPDYGKGPAPYRRLWDAMALAQWVCDAPESGWYNAGPDILINSEAFEIFRLTLNERLNNHLAKVAKNEQSKSYASYGNTLYFDKVAITGGVELNLATAKYAMYAKSYNCLSVPYLSGVGPKTAKFLDEYVDFMNGKPIEYGRTNYAIDPSKAIKVGSGLLSAANT